MAKRANTKGLSQNSISGFLLLRYLKATCAMAGYNISELRPFL